MVDNWNISPIRIFNYTLLISKINKFLTNSSGAKLPIFFLGKFNFQYKADNRFLFAESGHRDRAFDDAGVIRDDNYVTVANCGQSVR